MVDVGAGVLLTASGDDATASTRVTASITPTANRLVIVKFQAQNTTEANAHLDAAGTPISGCGITNWTKVQEAFGSTFSNDIWYGWDAAPTAGALTFNTVGSTLSATWCVEEYPDVDTANPIGAIAKSTTLSAGVISATVSPAPPTSSALISSTSGNVQRLSINDASATELADQLRAGGNRSFQSQYDTLPADGTLQTSDHTSGAWSINVVELRAVVTGAALKGRVTWIEMEVPDEPEPVDPTVIGTEQIPTYEAVLVARVPVLGSAHTRTVVGPIIGAQGLHYTNRLNRFGIAGVSFSPANQEVAVKARLLNLKDNPSEVQIIREGTIVFAGPVVGLQAQGQQAVTMSLWVRSHEYYLRYMMLESDLVFSGVDQYTIGKGLVDHYQALDYGNYGIVTSSIGLSSRTRTRNYTSAQQHEVYKRLIELGQIKNGFDFDISHDTRTLTFYATKGADLSSAVILDRRGVVDAQVSMSVSAGDIASEAHALGTGLDTDNVVSLQSNTALRAAFGRVTVGGSFDGVVEQLTLDNHAQAILDARDDQLFIPTPTVVPVEGTGVLDFDAGDTVGFSFDYGLGLQSVTKRVQAKTVSVKDNGNEDIRVVFV